MDRLETPRLILRPFRDEDRDDLYAYARDPRVGPPAGWPPHKSPQESLEIIRTVFAAPRTFAMELRETGRVVGSAGLVDQHHPELPGRDDELGYALSAAYWGRGLATEAAEALLRWSFEDLGLDTVWCVHYEGNQRSRRVMEKCGFRFQFSREADVPLLGERRLEHHWALATGEWLARRGEREEAGR